jgi:hypothetical protein
MKNLNFIESRLLGFTIDASGKEASFTIRTVFDKPRTICLKIHEIENLLMFDVRQQNIIDEIHFWSNQECNDELRNAILLLFRAASEESCHDAMMPTIQSKIDQIVKGDLILMQATAVYGAEFLSIFRSMEIIEISND